MKFFNEWSKWPGTGSCQGRYLLNVLGRWRHRGRQGGKRIRESECKSRGSLQAERGSIASSNCHLGSVLRAKLDMRSLMPSHILATHLPSSVVGFPCNSSHLEHHGQPSHLHLHFHQGDAVPSASMGRASFRRCGDVQTEHATREGSAWKEPYLLWLWKKGWINCSPHQSPYN